MKKLILVMFILLGGLVHAALEIQLNPSQIDMNDTFSLTLTRENPKDGLVPDFSPLRGDFEILGTEQRVSYSVINGQTQSSSQWIVSLKPKKSGILTIPAIKAGSEQSSPMTINVGSASSTPDTLVDPSRQEAVILLTGVNEKKPYVNQQIIYTVKLYNSKRLLDADYQGPQVDDALLFPLGDAKRYQALQNNKNYLVEEQSYAVFPQKSGTLKIKSPTFSALVYDLDTQRIKVKDKPIALTVAPIPKNYQGKSWLPAKHITLTEGYENTSQSISQGSTLIRTVTLEGVAIPAQLLPALHFNEADSFSVYPEKGKEYNQVKQGVLVSRTKIKVTYLFKKPGTVVIPELRISWFNTETAKEEVAVLPPRSIEITPSLTAAQASASPDISTRSMQAPPKKTRDVFSSGQNKGLWLLVILFALAWIITLGLWGWQRRPKNKYHEALSELKKACAERNAIKGRDALLKWASLHWPAANVLNLTDITKLARDADLKKQVNLLSQILYKNEGRIVWQGDDLFRSIQAFRRNKPVKKSKANRLPPINPF